jgi:hypothetical protein
LKFGQASKNRNNTKLEKKYKADTKKTPNISTKNKPWK